MAFRVADRGHPFYRPLWRRILLVALTGLWAGFEVLAGREPMWMVVACGLCAYSVWIFLITWRESKPDDASDKADDGA